MALSEESISRIKSLNISSVLASEDVFLKRVGREFVTHCVWHKDTNPSLTISDEKGFVFCHVCREGGDVIHFIQKKFGLTFREACERIAASSNIQLIYKDEDSSFLVEKKEKIKELLQARACEQSCYRANLKDSAHAVNFLRERKINPDTSRFFQLGYDKNENRITIPILDYQGKLVAFTGRAIGEEKPKYKNSENSLIFNKADTVFNEYASMEFVRSEDQCIFVEGHIDVISMWQSGIKNVVALQGTACPSDVVLNRMLRRTNNFVLCMDSDEGGEKAIGIFLKSVQEYALSGKLNIKIATLSEGKDPDEAIKNGVDIAQIIGNSLPWLDWILDKWLDKLDFNNNAKIQEVEDKIKELISGISSAALRAHYFDKAAIRLAQNKQNIAAQILKNLQSATPRSQSERTWKKPDLLWTRMIVERRLLRMYIHCKDQREYLRPLMDLLVIPDLIWLWKRIGELEEYSLADFIPFSVMAILSVAEPRYMQKLRSIARPSIKIIDSPGIISHIEEVMSRPLAEEREGTLF